MRKLASGTPQTAKMPSSSFLLLTCAWEQTPVAYVGEGRLWKRHAWPGLGVHCSGHSGSHLDEVVAEVEGIEDLGDNFDALGVRHHLGVVLAGNVNVLGRRGRGDGV